MLRFHNPFDPVLKGDLWRLEKEVDQLSGSLPWPSSIRASARGAFPFTNIGCNAEQVDVYLLAAGLEPKNMEITIRRNLLTLAAERKPLIESGKEFYRHERFEGSFRRVITLPEDVDPDKVDAHYADGVLHITIKRMEAVKPKQILVS